MNLASLCVGTVSTVGLLYRRVEAAKNCRYVRANPDHAAYRYEFVEAVRHILRRKNLVGARLDQRRCYALHPHDPAGGSDRQA